MFALGPVSHPADGWEGGFVFTLGSDDVVNPLACMAEYRVLLSAFSHRRKSIRLIDLK